MDKNAKIFVAGHRGLVGSALCRKLLKDGYTNIIVRSHAQLDLCNQSALDEFFKLEKPEYVFFAAAYVGGIGLNKKHPADFLYKNVMMGFNTVDASYRYGVKKLINIASACIYPKNASQPLKEEHLLTGALDPAHDAYALAKISVIMMCQKYHLEHGMDFFSVVPNNLYGPGDTYDVEGGHVLPSMIKKFHDAKLSGKDEVVLWGDGSSCREFLYNEDLADAMCFLMEHCSANELSPACFVNVGCGSDISIKELADKVMKLVYADVPERTCNIVWDTSKPNGMHKRLCDNSRLRELGWTPRVSLDEGLKLSYEDYIETVCKV